MRFLLVAVNAKFIHSNPAIYSLRACVGEKARSHVELAEYTINQYPSRILADIYRRRFPSFCPGRPCGWAARRCPAMLLRY